MIRLFIACVLALFPSLAWSQGAILQGGPWTQGHAPMYVGQGSSQPVVQDSGPAGGGALGLGLSEQLLVARGTGTPPFVGQGTGPYGTTWCQYDAAKTNPAGYHYLCLSANSTGTGTQGGLIAYGAGGGASTLPLNMIINGVSYTFPFSFTGITGPATSTVSDTACFANTQGTIVADCPGPANVVAFGADPTGVIDSTAFIAAAIATNRDVHFPCGTYLATSISQTYVLGQKFTGGGAGCTYLKWKAGALANSSFINIGNGSFGVETSMIDLTVECNGINQAGVGPCVLNQNNIHFLLTRAIVQNCWAGCILANDSVAHQSFFSSLFMTDSQVVQWDVGGGTNYGVQCGQYIYACDIGQGNIIYSQTAAPGPAIYANNSSNAVSVHGTVLFSVGVQIKCTGTAFCLLTGNQIQCGNGAACADGIQFVTTVQSVVTGNQFYGSNIKLTSTSTSNTICGNTFTVGNAAGPPTYAINEDGTSKNNIYCGKNPSEGNVIKGSYATGPYLVNGPLASTGVASIQGCTSNACTDSTDYAGTFTTGSAVSQFIISFGSAWITTPSCIATLVTSGSAAYVYISAVSTSGVQFNSSSAVTGQTVAYQCSGRKS